MKKSSDLSSFIKQILTSCCIFIVEQVVLSFWFNNPDILTSGFFLIFFVLLIFYILKKERLVNSSKTPKHSNSILKRILIALMFFLVVLVAITILTKILVPSNFVSETSKNQSTLNNMLKKGSFTSAFMIMYICIFGPIIEEYCFRYLLIPLSNKRYTIFGSIISVVFFTLLHLMGDFSNYPALISYATISIGLVTSYILLEDIYQNTINHIFWNSVLLIMNSYVSVVILDL